MALPEFVKKIKSRIDDRFRKHLYRNLVFKGGGVRAIAYMGALDVLDQLGIVDGIQRVAGTSAGAIAATLVSLRLSIPETRALASTLDPTKVGKPMTSERPLRFWESLDSESYFRLLRHYGWHSSQYVYEWVQGTVAEQCGGDGRATFADFRERGFRDVYIVASNVSRHQAEVFSAAHTPHVAVADAVRMSISIPIFFEALRFDGQAFGDGDYYVDGGLYDNFPMHLFDRAELAERSWAYRDGVNWETLGLFLFPMRLRNQDTPERPETVWKFLTLMLRNVYYAQQASNYQTNPVDKHRTIEISDCGIAPVELDVKRDSEKYRQLYASGQQAVRAFFELDDAAT